MEVKQDSIIISFNGMGIQEMSFEKPETKFWQDLYSLNYILDDRHQQRHLTYTNVDQSKPNFGQNLQLMAFSLLSIDYSLCSDPVYGLYEFRGRGELYKIYNT